MNAALKSVLFWFAIVVAAFGIYAYTGGAGGTPGLPRTTDGGSGGLLETDIKGSPLDPLSGNWVLNRARSHYGAGAEPRQEETMHCTAEADLVECRIASVRTDGRTLTAGFRAPYDGTLSIVTGIPDFDQVTISRRDESVADATFLHRGRRVVAYRLVQSSDRRSLTMISVDPETRATLSSVVVYDRR